MGKQSKYNHCEYTVEGAYMVDLTLPYRRHMNTNPWVLFGKISVEPPNPSKAYNN
jgi:hypothetical protein